MRACSIGTWPSPVVCRVRSGIASLPVRLVAGEEARRRAALVRRRIDCAVELPARHRAGPPEAVHGVAVAREPGGHQQLGPLPVRLLLDAEALAGERPRPAGERDMMSSKRRCTPRPSQRGADPVADQGADARAAVVTPSASRPRRTRRRRRSRRRSPDAGVWPAAPHSAERAVEAVSVALGRDVRRHAAHRLAGHVGPASAARTCARRRSQSAAVSSAARPGMSEVLLKLDAPHAIALADQVPADVGGGDARPRGELPVPVHEQHEPPVPIAPAPRSGTRCRPGARSRRERRATARTPGRPSVTPSRLRDAPRRGRQGACRSHCRRSARRRDRRRASREPDRLHRASALSRPEAG